VSIRNIRREILRDYEATSEDEKQKFDTRLDELTKTYIEKIDEGLKAKQASLLDLDNRWEIDQNRRKR
jgi:ribosome recycling factor